MYNYENCNFVLKFPIILLFFFEILHKLAGKLIFDQGEVYSGLWNHSTNVAMKKIKSQYGSKLFKEAKILWYVFSKNFL